jgi:hypothetical protein
VKKRGYITKLLFIGIFVLLHFFISRAQTNLVSNGSFETYTTCPNNYNGGSPDLISYAVGWYSSKNTPDYYNSCASLTTGVSTPSNLNGYQSPFNGQSYCGFDVYNNKNSFRESISCQLSSNLIIGVKYFVSFRINLSDNPDMAAWGINKIGILFSTKKYTVSTPPPVNNFAHVFTNSTIADSLNWTLIKGFFVADSMYSFCNVSNFFDLPNTDTCCRNPNTNPSLFVTGAGSYYLVDDIRVSTDSLFGLGLVGIDEVGNINNEISIYPNPVLNILHIKTGQEFEKGTEVEVVNILGQSILKFLYKREIDVSELPGGFYFLKIISSEKSRYHSKFIKQ